MDVLLLKPLPVSFECFIQFYSHSIASDQKTCFTANEDCNRVVIAEFTYFVMFPIVLKERLHRQLMVLRGLSCVIN